MVNQVQVLLLTLSIPFCGKSINTSNSEGIKLSVVVGLISLPLLWGRETQDKIPEKLKSNNRPGLYG